MIAFEPLPAVTVIQIMLSTWLFARCVPGSEGKEWTAVVYAACFVAGCIAINWAALLLTPCLTHVGSLVMVVTSFVLVLAGQVGFVILTRGASLWQAIFCATAAYAMQNLATGIAHTIGEVIGSISPTMSSSYLLEAIVTAAVYGCCYAAFIRKLAHEELAEVHDKGILFVLTAVIFVNIIFSLANNLLAYLGVSRSLVIVYGCVHAVICVFILFSELRMIHTHNLERDMAALEQLMADREHQYDISRETIDAINVKCHDIRHQIRLFEHGDIKPLGREALDDIAREVDVYDSAVKTGNDAIDTILTEKGLVCEREHISLSCIADGHLLGFMKPAELYALLGNALENAIEAARKVENPDRRVITLSISKRANTVLVHVENAFSGELAFEEGLPITTKADRTLHGFGMRSMRMCVERYGGTLSAGTHDGTFFLNMMIPLPASHLD